jgi:hypothetical protein
MKTAERLKIPDVMSGIFGAGQIVMKGISP